MYKLNIVNLFYLLLLISLVSCNNREHTSDNKIQQEEQDTIEDSKLASYEYVCPMRCEGSGQDKPGTCPVCHMLLARAVDVKDFGKTDSKHTQESVYKLESNWTTQNGEQIQLSDLSEHFQLVCMIFTSCPETCPNLIGNMLSIDEALNDETKENLKYTLVSIDPENDTPERLKAFAKGYELNSADWTLLHGAKDDVKTLSELLGVEYKRYGNGSFGHTNYIILLNPRGEVVYRLHGVNVPNEDIIDFMHKYI